MNEATPTAVSLDNLIEMAHGWLTAFEESRKIERLLLIQNMSAFLAYQDHVQQFSPSLSDIEIHRKCYTEYAKQCATMAPVLRFHPRECRNKFYKSEFLEGLRTELATHEGFTSVEEWHRHYRLSDWNIEPDPLLREMRRTMQEHGQESVDHFQHMYRDTAYTCLEKEAERYLPTPAGSFVADSRVSAFLDVAMSCLNPLGFTTVRTRHADYGALDLSLENGHILRWSIGEYDSFFYENSPALFQPTLSFREKSSRGKIKDAEKKTRILDFQISSLVEGVAEAYLHCQTLNELQAAMAAYTVIIEHSLPAIITAINNALYPGKSTSNASQGCAP